LPELPPPEAALPAGAAVQLDDGALRLSLATDIYSVDAILRSCYWLTDRCYVHLAASVGHVEVTLLLKAGNDTEMNTLAWEFLNSLVDNQLRVSIQRETAAVREMIISQAFADVDVIDDRGRPVEQTNPPEVDHQAITTWRPVP
jgi:His-Xaa-Ser system protein HxsD